MIWIQAILIGATAAIAGFLTYTCHSWLHGRHLEGLGHREAVGMVLGLQIGALFGAWCVGLAWWTLS